MAKYIDADTVVGLMQFDDYGRTVETDTIENILDNFTEEGCPEFADVAPVVFCKNCIHNNDCDIQYSAQAGENFFCGFGETEKDVREDVYERLYP